MYSILKIKGNSRLHWRIRIVVFEFLGNQAYISLNDADLSTDLGHLFEGVIDLLFGMGRHQADADE
jgi:hypothetical protein